MKSEDQVISLELAKKMKELGFEQESYFYWQGYLYSGKYVELVDGGPEVIEDDYDYISAYTVAELGEMLPEGIVIKRQYFRLMCDVDNNKRHYINYIPYVSGNTPGNNADMSVFEEHEKTIHNIWTDNFGIEGLHIGGSKSEANARAKCLIYLAENNLL